MGILLQNLIFSVFLVPLVKFCVRVVVLVLRQLSITNYYFTVPMTSMSTTDSSIVSVSAVFNV